MLINQILDGIKVADFSWVVAGPMVGKYLGDHGAQVIRIESMKVPCPLRTGMPYKDNKPGVDRSTYFCNYNNNKYGVTLDLKNPSGLAVAKKIIMWADIVIENFSPGAMSRLGLGYSEISKVKPIIIMISLSNQGQTGRRAQYPGMGVHLTGLSGFYHITGWPDRGPVIPNAAYTDIISPRFATAALIAALDYRDRTGKGQWLDLSQYESVVQFLAPLTLDYRVNNNRVAERVGNRSSCAAPHGAYKCQGNDKWCVIAVFNNQDWINFCNAVENPPWTKDPKFSSLLGRKENEDELNKLVETWTSKLTAEEVMRIMQNAGINSGIVQDCDDLSRDPQLKHREKYWKVEHPVIGKHICEAPAFKLSKTPAKLRSPAPCLGEHNEYVCTHFLGVSDKQFLKFMEEGAFN